MNAQLPAFAKQLKFDLGLEGDLFRKEEEGYFVQLEPTLNIEITPFDGGIAFRAPVGGCKEGSEELLVTLMHANLLGQGTGGGVLSLDGKGETIWLTQEVVEEVPYVEFRSRLEQFCNFAEYWQTMVSEA